MRERTPLRLLVLLAVLAVLAAACGGTGGTDVDDEVGEAIDTATDAVDDATDGDTEAGTDDVLVVGALEKPSALDPAEVYEKFASDILFNTTSRLVEYAPGETEVSAGVAEDWEISEDALTYTFTLRDDVTFHDGSELTSEDVKWSLERAININHPKGASFLLGGIETVEAPDPQTVVITLSEPNVTFLSRLNYTVASILPSDSDEYPEPPATPAEAGDDVDAAIAAVDEFVNNETIVGSGPYRLAEYQPGESITLEAFEDYHGDQPLIPTVRIQFFEDSAQMKNALDNGEIDVNFNEFGPAERASLEGNDDVNVIQGPGAQIRYLVFDVTQPPFDDPAVRRAVAATVDRQRIVDEVFEGAAEPLFSMIPPGFEDVYQDYISDIEAEVEGPIEFDLWYPLNKYGDTEPDVAETIARSLNESNIFNVTTQSADWASEYSQNLSNGAYGAYLLGWYPDYFDPDDYIEPFYDSEGFIGYYSNPQMDELIDAEQQETDPAARAEIFDEIQQLAAEDMPYVPLYVASPFAYYRDGVTGVDETLDAVQQTRYWVIGKE